MLEHPKQPTRHLEPPAGAVLGLTFVLLLAGCSILPGSAGARPSSAGGWLDRWSSNRSAKPGSAGALASAKGAGVESPNLPLAKEYHRQGRPQMAADLYAASVRSQPKDPHLRYLWAHALASAGEMDEAIEQARLGVKLDPNAVESQALLGILLRQRGDNREAISWLEKAWQGQPRSWEAGRELAEWHLARGDAQRATSVLELVLARRPDDRRALALLRQAEEQSGRPGAGSRSVAGAVSFAGVPEGHSSTQGSFLPRPALTEYPPISGLLAP